MELSFSSEEPYTRWSCVEILDHSPGAVDLSRLNEIGVVLFNHDRGTVLGRVERAWLDGDRGKAVVAFDEDETAETIYQKVLSGTLKGVSVGYRVKTWETVTAGNMSSNGKFTGPCDVATSWEPYEISIVSVPADPTVGVNRQVEASTGSEAEAATEIKSLKGDHSPMPTENVLTDEQVTVDAVEIRTAEPTETRDDIIAQERERVSQISGLCRDFDMDATDYISNGSTVEQVRAAILDSLRTNGGAPANVQVTRDEQDTFRARATDALIMRSGVSLENPAEGARELQGMSLRDLGIECLSREGKNINSLLRMSSDELYGELCREFYNPSAAFPAIMDQTIRKSVVELYNNVPTTFQAFTTKGTLKDFKTTADHEYVIGGVGDFLKVPENGEIKPDKPRTELLPSRKLDTYGKQFSMTRQAFINDDIGFLTQVPGLYATAAKKTIDKQVYGILYNNPTIFDGKALFHADHKNLISGAGAAPSQSTIQAAILQMQKQTDQFGDAIYMTPRTIVVGVGYEFDLKVVLHSTQVTGSPNNDINPLYNYPIQIVQSPVLNALAGANKCPWFMIADPSSARGIQVDYLNGQETPTVRRMEVPGTLGFVWDIYLDWGISVRDFRGIIKNVGAVIS